MIPGRFVSSEGSGGAEGGAERGPKRSWTPESLQRERSGGIGNGAAKAAEWTSTRGANATTRDHQNDPGATSGVTQNDRDQLRRVVALDLGPFCKILIPVKMYDPDGQTKPVTRDCLLLVL